MPEETEYQQMQKWFSQLEVILNPAFLTAFKRQLNACYEENKRHAYKEANISDDALEIEKMIVDLKKSIEQFKDHKSVVTFQIKCFYKELLKKFIK
jgi:hypothetical protein